MSGRLLSSGLAPLARRANYGAARRLAQHMSTNTGGLIRTNLGNRPAIRQKWPFGASSIHNVPAVRSISIARMVPKLFMKLARIPAMMGAGAVAFLGYIQYQATQAGNYAVDIWRRTTETTSSAANSLFANLSDIADQTRRGWDRTTDDVKSADWYQRIIEGKEEGGAGASGGNGGGGKRPKESNIGGSAAAGAGAATATAFGMDSDSEDDDRKEGTAAKDDQMMLLTKKMIEIRGLLQQVGQSETLTLPSIVVIGSQSSGKSSVLEAVVGHEFLPKGNNMVTRRPIELTLVNTPNSQAETAEFPALGMGKITDFLQVQKTLTDLNLSVPEKDCVSDDPIQLRIYSPKVPDLSLIDLPGYIQLSGFDQPTELKQKIAELCEKYIKAPNIILAVSAADVDLANSTSLRASRRVDPRGERTIGVITKMDLVDAERGASILQDKKYPLRLGYVGVACKIPQSTGLFSRGSANITNAIAKHERAFFSTHPQFSPENDLTVGTVNLRQKLMRVLETTMSNSLVGTSEAIQQELAETNYEFKVQYNDRPLSAESYLAESLDTFKHSFKQFSESFGRPEIRQLLKHELDQQVLNLLASRYWNKPLADLTPGLSGTNLLEGLAKADPDDQIWHHKVEASRSALTKLGIGRLATSVVAASLQAHVDHLISNSTFISHPFAKQAITDASANILRDLSFDTSDELEICIKPYKYRTEVDDAEWKRGQENVGNVLKEELRTCEDAFKSVEKEVGGGKKLKDVVGFIDRVRKGDIVLEGDGTGGAGGFSSALLLKGRDAVFLRDRAEILKMRLKAVRSKQCSKKENAAYCPEVFLDAVAERLTSTADLFIDAELLSKFYYYFPRELDQRLGRNLTQADMERFAREDPKIKRHLDVVKRKELLELVLKEMNRLRQIDDRERRRSGQEPKQEKSRGWGFF